MTTITFGILLMTILLVNVAMGDVVYDYEPDDPPPTGPQTLSERMTADQGMSDFTLDCYNNTWDIRLISMQLYNETTGAIITCHQIDLDLSRTQCNSRFRCYLSVYYPGFHTCGNGNGATVRAEVTYECLQLPGSHDVAEMFPTEAGSPTFTNKHIVLKSGFNYPYFARLDPYDTTCTINLVQGQGNVKVDYREITYDPNTVQTDVTPYEIKVGNQNAIPAERKENIGPTHIRTPTEIAFNMNTNSTINGRFWIVLTADGNQAMNVTCTNSGGQWLLDNYTRGVRSRAGSTLSGLVTMVTMVIATLVMM